MAMGLLTGGLATALIDRLVVMASTQMEGYFKRRKGKEEELQRLKRLLPRIQSVVNAAERGEQQISDPLKKWLLQLKDALYEADDVLDELDYLQLKQQAEADDDANKKEQHKVRELMSRYKRKAIKLGKNIIRPDPTLVKLRKAVEKLGEVAADAGNFVALVSDAQWEFQQQEAQTILKRETGALLTENKVFGREKQRDELLRWLTADHEEESNMKVSLFSVVGHGGMGKTTLAQLVFNDEMIQKSFHLKIWVCVSTSFDVRGLTRSILESATGKRPKVDALPALQDALKEKLKTSGKFLLVLDDVWNDDDTSNWEKLLAPLNYGQKGSKILLTTRMDRVADMAAQAIGASTKESLKLGGLHGEVFYSLFDRYAFAGVDYRNYPNLQPIGKQIAKRLGGSPLAAKIVGGLLKFNLDDRYWNKILDSKNISDRVQNGKDNIMPILMLSYHHLPPHLRPCFAYCGMFPEDHLFRKEDLVLMWMAVGLVQRSHQNQGEMPEDIGGRYFDHLLSRSLFDHRDRDYYVMHDLLHDLAQSVSHGECFSFVDDDEKVEDTIPNTVCHLYIKSGNLDRLTKMDNWHNLCSLVLIIKDKRPEHFSALEKVFKSLKSIRMLHVDLRWREITMPDAFSHLIHLRSLKITDGGLQQFPPSLCKLYHLQVLKFSYTVGTIELPESMNKLVNLRHLSASDQVAGVGKLISLQELDFSVKKGRGYKIGELVGLIWLRKLRVGGLENVESKEEASVAKLGNKRYLETLHLGWGDGSDPGMDEHELVLDRLQPHANLKELKIDGYRGIRYANWMGFELINNLRHIRLSKCPGLDHLPPLGRLPFLEKLELEKMPAIKKLDYQCQHLKELIIRNMEGLEELSGSGADAGQWHPHLHTLRIENCPKLEVLPSLSPSISKIHLDNLGLVSLPTLWLDSSSTCSTGGSSSSSASLKVLGISKCGKITSLGKGLLQLQHYLTALERLDIWNCPELVDFPSGGLQHLRALKSLSIENCPKLQVAPDPITPDGNDDKFLPSSVQSIEIIGCAELERSMPTLLKGIVSLDFLSFEDCEELMSLEGLMGLQSVGSLEIRDCPKLVHAAGSDFTIAVDRLEIDDPLLLVLGVFTSVRGLTIFDCGQLESIDGQLEQWLLQNQATLKWIRMYEASSLKSLPGCLKNLSSLRYLGISEASEALKERCRKDEGADWPTICHIPHVSIGEFWYIEAYKETIGMLPSKESWVQITYPYTVKPPNSRRPRGRPKTERIRGKDEKRKEKSKLPHRCTRCGEWGHHKTTCKNPLNSQHKGSCSNTASVGKKQSKKRKSDERLEMKSMGGGETQVQLDTLETTEFHISPIKSTVRSPGDRGKKKKPVRGRGIA